MKGVAEWVFELGIVILLWWGWVAIVEMKWWW